MELENALEGIAREVIDQTEKGLFNRATRSVGKLRDVKKISEQTGLSSVESYCMSEPGLYMWTLKSHARTLEATQSSVDANIDYYSDILSIPTILQNFTTPLSGEIFKEIGYAWESAFSFLSQALENIRRWSVDVESLLVAVGEGGRHWDLEEVIEKASDGGAWQEMSEAEGFCGALIDERVRIYNLCDVSLEDRAKFMLRSAGFIRALVAKNTQTYDGFVKTISLDEDTREGDPDFHGMILDNYVLLHQGVKNRDKLMPIEVINTYVAGKKLRYLKRAYDNSCC
jgi:hypothetical protein